MWETNKHSYHRDDLKNPLIPSVLLLASMTPDKPQVIKREEFWGRCSHGMQDFLTDRERGGKGRSSRFLAFCRGRLTRSHAQVTGNRTGSCWESTDFSTGISYGPSARICSGTDTGYPGLWLRRQVRFQGKYVAVSSLWR